jgi:hypothetical protein
MEQLREPIVGHLLAKAWLEQRADKPTALGTPLRYSSALGCERQMGYEAFGAEKTNPPGLADAWAPGIGTELHEALQREILRKFPNTLFELKTKAAPFVSGSLDGLLRSAEVRENTGIELGGTHAVWEFKTMGEYPFDKQVGFNRRYGKISGRGEGPKLEAITQAGLNALGAEATLGFGPQIESLVLTSVTLATVSVNKAGQMNLGDWERFGSEWIIRRDEWEPLALEELNRMSDVAFNLDAGFLSDRNSGRFGNEYLSPRSGKNWQCDYCPFKDRCIDDGGGVVEYV